jgi:hypothetical protein
MFYIKALEIIHIEPTHFSRPYKLHIIHSPDDQGVVHGPDPARRFELD